VTSKFNINQSLKTEFQKAVIKFYEEKGRDYPWRKAKDPFKILIAEILIRLTGAWKAEKVYGIIISKYGNAKFLSKANVEELENIIRPLGLIHRAKLLIKTSSEIVDLFECTVPNDFTKLTSLSGVGRYTANAILCFGYGRRVPLVDESVRRVLTRCLNFISLKPAYLDNDLWSFAENLLPDKKIKEYNLGLIDLGAMFCKHPKSLCYVCPLKSLEKGKTRIN
jgi:A/G-specific adenine glycosylase